MEKYTTFPVNRQLFQVLVECWAATKVCDWMHGSCLGHRQTFLTVHLHQSINGPYRGMLHSWNQSATGENPVGESTGDLSIEVKKNRRFQPRDLQGDHQPWILSFRQKECIHRISCDQDYRSRNFSLTNSLHLHRILCNQDYRSRNFNLTNSLHLQRFHVGRKDSRPK